MVPVAKRGEQCLLHCPQGFEAELTSSLDLDFTQSFTYFDFSTTLTKCFAFEAYMAFDLFDYSS